MSAAVDLDQTFTALADPTRRKVIELLQHQPRRAGELASEVGMSRPAMSRHLRVLRTHGLVEETSDRADARARVYRLRPEPIEALSEWLAEVQRFWDDQLDSFRELAHARAGKDETDG